MAGCTLVFILSMGVYLTPVIMGGNFVVTLPMLIEDAVRNRYNCSEASAMALLLLIAIGIMIVISSSIQKWSEINVKFRRISFFMARRILVIF